MGTFKHNKKRDTGLVYEFLVRKLSQTMVEHDQAGYARTLEIVRKYYGEGTPLAEERELFDVVRNARGLSEAAARRVLAEVQRHAQGMDDKLLDIKKSNLIKEINYAFGRDFFSNHRIPEYRLLASIQMVIDAARTQTRLTESVSKIQLEEGLVKYMMSRGSFAETVTPKSEIDAVVMAMVAKRFEEKYSKTLGPAQKVLLEKFIRFQVTGDGVPLQKFVMEEAGRIGKILDRALAMTEVTSDKAMLEKLTEAKKNFLVVSTFTKEQLVEEVMMYQKLAEEVESDE